MKIASFVCWAVLLFGEPFAASFSFHPGVALEVPVQIQPEQSATPDESVSTTVPPRSTEPPLTLNEALKIAMEQSPLILEAEDAIKHASGFTVQARAAALPQLFLATSGALADRYRTSNSSGTVPGTSQFVNVPASEDRDQEPGPQWSIQLKLVKTVFDAGQNRDLIGAAKVSEAMARYSMEETVQQVCLQIKLAFYQVLYEQQELDVYREALGKLQQQTGLVQSQMQLGSANQFDFLRAQTAVDGLAPLGTSAQAAVEAAEDQLAILLGLDYDDAQRRLFGSGVAGGLANKVSRPSLDEALRRATNDRPLIHQLESAVEAERLGMLAEAAEYYPKISLFTAIAHSYENPSPDANEKLNNNGYVIGLSGVWAVFDGELSRGKQIQAQAQFSSAVHALQATRLSSEFNLRQTLRSLDIYQHDVDLQGPILDRLHHCDEIARQRAVNGTGSLFESIQALQGTTGTRVALAQQVYQLNAASAQIDYLMGRVVNVAQENGTQH